MRVEAEVRFTSWHVFSLIYTINISKGGMNLELAEEARPGAALIVKITPPDGVSIELEAVVRHAEMIGTRWNTGVQFTNLDDARRAAIERTIRAHGGTLQAPELTPRGK